MLWPWLHLRSGQPLSIRIELCTNGRAHLAQFRRRIATHLDRQIGDCHQAPKQVTQIADVG